MAAESIRIESRFTGNPVLVVDKSKSVELRIGDPKPGESRIALLSPSQARLAAYALLAAAEEATGDHQG